MQKSLEHLRFSRHVHLTPPNMLGESRLIDDEAVVRRAPCALTSGCQEDSVSSQLSLAALYGNPVQFLPAQIPVHCALRIKSVRGEGGGEVTGVTGHR